MKRYLSLLIFVLLLCTALCACTPEDTSDTLAETTVGIVTDTTPDTDAATDTVAESETEAELETEPETEQETETEPETEPAPEVLVSAIPPKQVLKTIIEDVTPLEISTVSKQVTLQGKALADVQDAFLKEGYFLSYTKPAHDTNLQTAVLKSLDHTVTLIQTSDGSLHVLWEKAAEVSAAPLAPVRNAEKGDVTMAQIGVARGKKEDNPMIGMCYVYRLADGTAVIIDGGVNNKDCAENLYHTLQKLDIATDENGKYKITAWIFSHGHADHIGTFKKFASLYADKADVTYFMYSFPIGDISPKSGDPEAFATTIREAFPNALRVSPHAGLTYHFGNLSVHVLYAPELLYTTEKGVDYYNTTSMILRVEANGQSILHMGDASEASSQAAWNENKSTAFKSNLLQITHHGLYTGPESHEWKYIRKIYQATEATMGLLPMGTRLSTSGRNGRHTVLVAWGTAGYQISFVIDRKDCRNGATTDQTYYDNFVADVAAGVATRETLFGYDGINAVKNRDGMITYISSNETAPMATVFKLSEAGITVESNQELASWLGQ